MYNISFNMKKAKYLVILKESFYKYKNSIYTIENRVYMDREHGIYTYTFEDTLTFLKKQLITYFSQNNLKTKKVSERKYILYNLFSKFNIYDLSNDINLREECNDKYTKFLWGLELWDLEFRKNRHDDLYSTKVQNYIYNFYKIISEIAEWNGLKSYTTTYLYPVLIIDREYNHWKYQYRNSFHTRYCCNYFTPTKRETIAGSDPEYIQFLTMRQRHRDSCLNYSTHKNKKNRNNVPGDWKHYNKCRKQWAKNIENPSYEKLSRAVWKQELVESTNDMVLT